MKKTYRLLSFLAFFLAVTGGVEAQKSKKSVGPDSEVKFLDDIEISFSSSPKQVSYTKETTTEAEPLSSIMQARSSTAALIEKAGALQFKYALLLDTEVEMVQNTLLFSAIDYWFGTRYRLGGDDKSGIDCSALMQSLYSKVYNISIPRTVREIYKVAKSISRTELKEGDLVFFNTVGGVSHIGLYLQNNKFLHASSSEGVTISDLYEPYWSRRFVGVGRIVHVELAAVSIKP